MYRAQTQSARTTGAQSIGVRKKPCQASNCVPSRYGGALRAGQHTHQLHEQREHQRRRPPTRRCCGSPSTTSGRTQRRRRGAWRRRAGWRRADRGCGGRTRWCPRASSADGGRRRCPPARRRRRGHRERGHRHVGECGQDLAGEELAALTDRVRTCLSVPSPLGRDDVARDERREERQPRERDENQHDQREHEAGCGGSRPAARRAGRPLWTESTTTKRTGTRTAAPRPRYVRFCARSLRAPSGRR